MRDRRLYMLEQDRPTPAREEQLSPHEPPLSLDELWDELLDAPKTMLDQELLHEAREYAQQKYDETYWEAVRREAEAFWDRRYDPDAPEDW